MTDKPDDGGPAFPTDGFKCDLSKYDGPWGEAGMTLRQYYAGQALLGILAGRREGVLPDPKAAAQNALLYTDALIAAEKES